MLGTGNFCLTDLLAKPQGRLSALTVAQGWSAFRELKPPPAGKCKLCLKDQEGTARHQSSTALKRSVKVLTVICIVHLDDGWDNRLNIIFAEVSAFRPYKSKPSEEFELTANSLIAHSKLMVWVGNSVVEGLGGGGTSQECRVFSGRQKTLGRFWKVVLNKW